VNAICFTASPGDFRDRAAIIPKTVKHSVSPALPARGQFFTASEPRLRALYVEIPKTCKPPGELLLTLKPINAKVPPRSRLIGGMKYSYASTSTDDYTSTQQFAALERARCSHI
jgi:hypothetical protein